jgi:hypothetical protein
MPVVPGEQDARLQEADRIGGRDKGGIVNKTKVAVDQILYRLPVNNAARYGTTVELEEVVVEKVGKKYFTVRRTGERSWGRTTHHLDNWREKSDYSPDYVLYASRQEYDDEHESGEICQFIYRSFEYRMNRLDVSIDDLRRIKAILEGYKK